MKKISYQDEVEKAVYQAGAGRLIVAATLYQTQLSHIPEFTYYKALERMVERNRLMRITKGIYLRSTVYTGVEAIKKEIITYFTEENAKKGGVFLGEALLAEKQLYKKQVAVTQTESVGILTNYLRDGSKKIASVHLASYPGKMGKEEKKHLEAIEILRCYEDKNLQGQIDVSALLSYLSRFTKEYNDDVMREIFRLRSYPKHTIAFLKQCLNQHGVDNTLKELLSGTSRYRIPEIAG